MGFLKYMQWKKFNGQISNNKKTLLYCRLVASFLLLIYLMYSRMGIHHFCSFFKENEVCHICRKEFEACEEQYPCRICDKVFHKDCVLSLKELHPSHLTAIKRANTSVGWSCPECVRFFIERAQAPDVMYLSHNKRKRVYLYYFEKIGNGRCR